MPTSRACAEDSSSLAGLAAPCEGHGTKNEDGIGGCRGAHGWTEKSSSSADRDGVGLGLPPLPIFA